ncbi:MAG: response regulator [Planctomycetes bacterium]|jgi:response regulator RpfG family c-di-GMP phosphodiesterase|nr:response regulator [Planctomycetota bacterium]
MEQKSRVLVVDDERAIAELVAHHLSTGGLAARQAYDGAEAIEALECDRFDLVVSDISMPRRSGLDVLEAAHHRDRTLPVIMLTSNSNLDTAVKAMRMGAADYVLKPFTLDALDMSVERAFERRRLLLTDQHYRENLELAVAEKTGSLRKALSELQVVFNATVEAMVSAIEARDCETQHHCRRAREYTLMLAHRMGIRGTELRDIGWGSLLHDVGKIGVRDDILLKRGALTPTEWDEMRRHPVVGFQLLSPIAFLSGAAQIVLNHHEHWDGSGYPYGKRGDEIPLGARVFMVADAIEAITSRRVYKAPLPFEAAEEEIVRCSGTHFDPAVVDVFRSIPRPHWVTARRKFLADSRCSPASAFTPLRSPEPAVHV